MTDGSTATHRILIVDDEETTRDLLKIIFEEDPYQITTADGVQAAIALLEEQPFDLLMTDKNMPDGTGLDVAQRVRDLGLDTEIIMISAYASVESAVKAMHLAVADYVEKPFRDTEVIRRSVAGALEVLTLKRANRKLVAELQTKNAELEALATRDPLIKLFNHAFFQQALDGEVVRRS